ncbi:unnamed protein product [Closterium sp. NIES-64]|nr:unnamed protein product [Closterium sp. NIES-64]
MLELRMAAEDTCPVPGAASNGAASAPPSACPDTLGEPAGARAPYDCGVRLSAPSSLAAQQGGREAGGNEEAVTAGSVHRAIVRHAHCSLACGDRDNLSPGDVYRAAAMSVRDHLIARMDATERAYDDAEQYSAALQQLGVSMEEAAEEERDPALGNGGLGRLAACFLDSLTTLNLPAWGYGVRYRYGMFEQRVAALRQQEAPDAWLHPWGCPWEIPRPHVRHPVRFFGHVAVRVEGTRTRYRWEGGEQVEAVASDIPVPGFKTATVNRLRLWRCEPLSGGFDLSLFNAGRHVEAVGGAARAAAISAVLYPEDSSEAGRQLRLQQEYFFVSATLQDIIARHVAAGRPLSSLPEAAAVQLNDTHPALAVPEAMRLLLDEHGLEWGDAWRATVALLAFTNHTVLPEALERWPVPLLQTVLPRVMDLIFEINHRHLQEVEARCMGEGQRMARLSIIEESHPKMVRMAVLAAVGSHAINGVAELHSTLLRTQLFPDFVDLFPTRFHNKTNGVTPRRWLLLANPRLSQVITKWLGSDEWVRDLSLIQGLRAYANSPALHADWTAAKVANKERLAVYIRKTCGVQVESAALFDCHAKRIHEYKRQLLNILAVIHRYNSIKCSSFEERARMVPRVVVIAGKAAPGYFRAKCVIHLINAVAARVNSDSDISGLLKVVFLPNYSVSLAQLIVPASDISQHISTAGMEASGTSNMKFALNGGLLLGTMDGATIEIANAIGRENVFVFGALAHETHSLRHSLRFRQPIHDDRLVQVVRTIEAGVFGPADDFRPLLESLGGGNDYFLLSHDWPSYLDAQHSVDTLFLNPTEWCRRSIIAASMMGRFSSDRTIAEYARDIWHLQSAPTSPSKPPPFARRAGSADAGSIASDAGSAYAESSASGDDDGSAGWSMAGEEGKSNDAFHVIHKVPVGDSPYVRAKHVQLVDKDPVRAIALFWSAINAGDRVDSALKDMAIVMKQQNRPEEAIEAIRSLRHKCSEVAQESLDNVLLDLFKRCGRLDDQVALLKHKLDMIRQGVAFNGKRTKTARSQGKKFQVSIEQEATRLLGNLGWAYMQQGNYVAAESVYRKALRVEADSNKVCNLGICLMKQARIVEARALLESVSPNSDPRWGSESHIKSYERAQSMLVELETSAAAAESAKDGAAASAGTSGGEDASASDTGGKSAASASAPSAAPSGDGVSSDKLPQVKPAFRGMGGMGMGMGLARSSFQRHSSYLCEFLGAPDMWDSLMADSSAAGGNATAEGAPASPQGAAGGSSGIAGMQSRGPPDAPPPQKQQQRPLQAQLQCMRRPPATGAMARTMSMGAGCGNPLARSMSFGGADARGGLSCLKPNAPEFMPGSFGPIPPPGHGSAPPFMHGAPPPPPPGDGRRTLTASRSLPPLQIPTAGFAHAAASPSLVSPLGPMSSGSLSCSSSFGAASWDDGLMISAFESDDDVLCEMPTDSYQPSAAAISVAAGVWASQKPPASAHLAAAMRKGGGFPAPGQRALYRGTENVPQYMAGGAPIGAGGPGARRPLVFGCENPAPMAAKAQMVAGGLMGGGNMGMQMGAEMGGGMGMTTVMGERTNLEPPAQFMGAWGAVAQGKGAWGPAWGVPGEGGSMGEGEKAKDQQQVQQQSVAGQEVGGSGMKRNRVPTPVKAAAPKGERGSDAEGGDASGAQEGGPVVPRALWEMLGFTGSPDKLLLEELKATDSAKKLLASAGSADRQQGSERRTLFADNADTVAAAVCVRQHRDDFSPTFVDVVRPALLSTKAGSPGDKVLRFFKTFLGVLVAEGSEGEREMMEELLCLFSQYSEARSKAVRVNVTRVLSEVLNSLPGSFSLSADAIVIIREFLHCRMDDKIAVIRAWAARALKRMVTFEEDGGVDVDTTIGLFREKMKTESSSEVREAMVWSLPESTSTIPDILERTADVSERVRAAAYKSFAERFFPIESFSIRQRVQLLSQGLGDRSPTVRSACVELLCRAWLSRDCEGDLVRLLRHVDVESHEAVAESAVREVLQAHSAGCGDMELVVPEGGLRAAVKQMSTPAEGKFLEEMEVGGGSSSRAAYGGGGALLAHAVPTPLRAGQCQFAPALASHVLAFFPLAEFALAVVCLEDDVGLTLRVLVLLQENGSNAAISAGAAAVVAAEAASDLNAQLEALLPATAQDYLTLLETHMQAGSEGRFAARQLMQLAAVLDFTDATIRAHAAALVHRHLVGAQPAREEAGEESAEAEDEWEEGVADGRWGEALLGLAQRVHASDADVLAALVDALADVSKPMMAGVAGVDGVSEGQWLRCVAATRMVLRLCCKSAGGGAFRAWRNLRVEPQEALNCILVPAVRARAAPRRCARIRCTAPVTVLILRDPCAQTLFPLPPSPLLCWQASHPSPLVRAEAVGALHAFAMLHAPSARAHLPLLHAAARDSAHPGVQMAAVRALADLLLWHRPAALLPDIVAPALSDEGEGSAVSGCSAGEEAQRAGGARGGRVAEVAEGSVDVLVGLVPLEGGQVDIEGVREDVQRAGRQADGEDEEEAEGVVGVVCEGLSKLLLADASRAGGKGAERGAEGRVERVLQVLVQVYLCPGAAEDELPRTRQMLAELFNRVAVLPACKVAASRLLLPVLRQLWPRKTAAAARQPAVRASQLLLSLMLAHGAHGFVPPKQSGEGEGERERERAEEGEEEAEGRAAGGGDGEGENSGVGESSRVEQPALGFESLALDLAAEVGSLPTLLPSCAPPPTAIQPLYLTLSLYPHCRTLCCDAEPCVLCHKRAVLHASITPHVMLFPLPPQILSSPLATSGSASGRAYSAHLVHLLVEVPLRASQQDDVKCLRSLLPMVAEAVQGQRAAQRLVEQLAARLRALDATPDEELPLERLEQLLQRVDGDAASASEAGQSGASAMEGCSPPGRRRRGKPPGTLLRMLLVLPHVLLVLPQACGLLRHAPPAARARPRQHSFLIACLFAPSPPCLSPVPLVRACTAPARRTSPLCNPNPTTPVQCSARPSRQCKAVANSRLKQQLGGHSSAGRPAVGEAAVGESEGVDAGEGVEQVGREGQSTAADVPPEAHSSGSEEESESSESEEYGSGSESGSEEEYRASVGRHQRGARAQEQTSGPRRVASVIAAVRRRRSSCSSSGGGGGGRDAPISISTDSDSQDVIEVVEVVPGVAGTHSKRVQPKEEAESISEEVEEVLENESVCMAAGLHADSPSVGRTAPRDDASPAARGAEGSPAASVGSDATCTKGTRAVRGRPGTQRASGIENENGVVRGKAGKSGDVPVGAERRQPLAHRTAQ